MKIHTKLLRIIRWIVTDSIQKRLGYPKDIKLLIIHADDLGFSGSENRASIEAIEKGMIKSGSIMVPCPGFHEIAGYAKAHPEADLGIHLTITSEWPSYKWRPVLSPAEVPSIVDKDGFLFESKAQLMKNPVTEEVEKEFRAQINLAVNSGINLTHIDSHMFTAFSNRKILESYISLGKEYKLPVLLINEVPFYSLNPKNIVIVNKLYHARPDDYFKGLTDYYKRIFESLEPGLNCILAHLAFDDAEMKEITRGQPNYGSAMRQTDFDFFTGYECRQLIEENNIKLITWREIRDKLFR